MSTHPASFSGWLRRDLIDRIANASGLPVEHVVVDIESEGLPFRVTLVVAARTLAGEELLEHLKAKGKVSTMTKAASHLLWDDGHFATIRDYLATHTDWMISDTTGFPPRIAAKYGFVQDFYGAFEWPEPFGTVNNSDATAIHEAFKSATPISFRYGYPDPKSHGHIVVTHKPDVVAKPQQ